MDVRNLLPPEVLEALERGQTVLTANQRAARMLQRGYARHMEAEGHANWQPAAILAVDAWATDLWQRMLMAGAVDRVVLNRSQEHALWRAVVAGDRESSVGLRSVDALAEMAARAWSLLANYRGLGRLREIGVSTDTRAFQRWALAFERRCRRDGLFSPTQLWVELEAAAASLPVADAGLLLVGFDKFVPALDALFETLRRAGYAVEIAPVPTPEQPPRLIAAKTESQEAEAAALWARAILEASPEAQLAVIVPDLEPRRPEIDRVFREILAPELQDIALEREAGPYEFSLGRPLSEMAMGAVGLDLLRWPLVDALPVERVTELLLSPFFGGGTRLAEFDVFELRRARRMRPELSLDQMIEAAQRSIGLGDLPGRLARLRQIAAEEQVTADSTALRPHAEWGEAFARMIAATGWPGREYDSITFQTHRRWQAALDELATLDFDGARATASDAFAAFERIARQTIFAAESREAPVQLMGPLEAGGQHFDGVWFLGASDLAWPQAATTSPLLPWHLQRELGMPGADRAVDVSSAKAITARLQASATQFVFSYASEVTEGQQKPSPILPEMNEELAESRASREVFPLLTVADDLSLPELPDRPHPGGAGVLAAQAACGFRAFAEHRLWSTEPEDTQPGMDARERGSVVHHVMEAFWLHVEDQPALRRMTTEAQHALLDECIESALGRATARMGVASAWEVAYVETQRQRLRALLRPWLELEANRPEFAVRAQELELPDVRVGPLRLSVRVDRVDDTAAGALIVDYKTGAAAVGDWASERPDAPQLPLYAVVAGLEPLGGVAFALLRAGDDLDLRGLAEDPAVLAKSSKLSFATMDEQVEDWRRVLTNLAGQFAAGEARVDPKRYPTTCQYCAQRMLCRLNVAALNDSLEDEGVELG
ncbi:probable DNA repair protein [Granulicella rosea]|uniref:Probable DNA repair protein n=1 Tax=Granulicella rosea TaxID=474952 RepID=A0A239ETY8_9BACT|nr:PD-(D/E)XK nuclease family protein [Granulicella rosea]SNS48230.1 probable DNA repair protein [Granulicella rosea]